MHAFRYLLCTKDLLLSETGMKMYDMLSVQGMSSPTVSVLLELVIGEMGMGVGVGVDIFTEQTEHGVYRERDTHDAA